MGLAARKVEGEKHLISILNRNANVFVDSQKRVVTVYEDDFIGIGTWGKIERLQTQFRYALHEKTRDDKKSKQ